MSLSRSSPPRDQLVKRQCLASRWLLLRIACCCLIAFGRMASADVPPPPKTPPPEDVSLRAEDGFELLATYYPGTEGKDTVPIILVHMFKGDRSDFDELAKYLQSLGHAVIVPDLRGHGESRGQAMGLKIEPTSLRPADFEKMAALDLEVVKRYLIEKNNQGELNIEKLCVVGAEMGSLVAARWAAMDWNWPPLATGKQGQDVKALVLISPEWQFKTLRMIDALGDPAIRSEIAIQIIVGKGNSKGFADAKRMYSGLERFHPEHRGLELAAPNTNLVGTKLLAERNFGLHDRIGRFLDQQVVKRYIPWDERKKLQ